MSQPAASAIISVPKYSDGRAFMTNEVGAEPALCAAEIPMAEDARAGNQV